jgi:hypothetical protein
MPEAGEELLTDFRRTRDQPLSFIRLRSLASGNPEVRARLLALARVTTTTCPQGREVVWQVSP